MIRFTFQISVVQLVIAIVFSIIIALACDFRTVKGTALGAMVLFLGCMLISQEGIRRALWDLGPAVAFVFQLIFVLFAFGFLIFCAASWVHDCRRSWRTKRDKP